jgi:hypothetical protein
MAARAIVGIILGILFAPVIFILLTTISYSSEFANWFWSLFQGNFTDFAMDWVYAGGASMVAPLMPSMTYLYSLIEGFGAGSLLTQFLPNYLPGLVTWTIIGMWAGAIERSAGRGIGVGAGIWLGWLIIELVFSAVKGLIGIFIDVLLAQLLTLLVVILVAAIFGAMTRSEEL